MKTFAEKNWHNCENAVAYSLNFVQMCYGYGSDSIDQYVRSSCKYCENDSIQFRDFEYPKGQFSKKDYFILDSSDYAVSDALKQYMIDYGVDKKVFRPIYTRKHDIILGWQIAPRCILPDTFEINGFTKKIICNKCNYSRYTLLSRFSSLRVYNGLGYPDFINQEALNVLNKNKIAITSDKLSVYISLDLYNHLLEEYPRIECRPVFLGEIKNDPEYKRTQGTVPCVLISEAT